MNRFDAMRLRLWRPAWWQLALLAAVGIAVILAIAIVAQRFLARRAARRGDVHPGGRFRVIDAEYEVISTKPVTERSPRDSDDR